eukprot:s103_g75.t1
MHAVLKEQEIAQLSLQSHAREVHGVPSRSSDLWPCPIPLWSWTGSNRLSPRRRHRRKFLQIRAQVLQRVVAILNWECLGHPLKPPAKACARHPFTDDQWDMLCRLERLVDHFLRADDISATSLGRSGEKFAHMFRAAKELPEYQDVDLLDFDEQYDRLILSPQRVNARLQSFSHYTKSLAPGSLFALIRPAPDQELRVRADDLADMYYTIQVSEAPAKRNCIGFLFNASELQHLTCFDPAKHRGSRYVALGALAMGDSWAAEFAQQPVLAILFHAFSKGANRPQNEVFQLSRESRNELCALSMLGPLCISDMRVAYAPFVFCTAASPYGGGICVATETEQVVSELWRHSEQRGYYTQLLNPAGAVLAEMGLDHLDDEFPSAPDWLHDSSLRVPAPLHEGIVQDRLELFRGEGNWSQAHASLGFKVHDELDIKGSAVAFGNLLDDSVFHQLVSLALRRVVKDWHAGPPCYTYGTLRRRRIRSKEHPASFRLKDPLTFEQTRLALRIFDGIGDFFKPVFQRGTTRVISHVSIADFQAICVSQVCDHQAVLLRLRVAL